MSDNPQNKKTIRILTVIFAPVLITLIVLTTSHLFSMSRGSELIPWLSFLTPLIGVVSLLSTEKTSGISVLLALVFYYPIMLGLVLLVGLMFGCGALKMFCW